MTRRRLILLSLCCLLAGVAVWVAWPRSSDISAVNAARIEPGMTIIEVEGILGGPARDESTGPLATADSDNDAAGQVDLLLIRTMQESGWGRPLPATWVSDSVVIQIEFVDGRAGVPQVFLVRRVRETPWKMLRRWLKVP
jgi:hypothetical protein